MNMSGDTAVSQLKKMADERGVDMSISRCRRQVLKYLKEKKRNHVVVEDLEFLSLLMKIPPVPNNSRTRGRVFVTGGRENPRGILEPRK